MCGTAGVSRIVTELQRESGSLLVTYWEDSAISTTLMRPVTTQHQHNVNETCDLETDNFTENVTNFSNFSKQKLYQLHQRAELSA